MDDFKKILDQLWDIGTPDAIGMIGRNHLLSVARKETLARDR